MKVLISGANGRMGRAVHKKIAGNEVVCGVSRKKFRTVFPVYTSFDEVTEDFDVIIDFTVSENTKAVIDFARKTAKPLVIGTTALSQEDEALLEELAKEVPVLYSHNTSFGVNIFNSILEYAANKLKEDWDIEIIEKHDRDKLDAPSGTSKMLVHSIEKGAGKKYTIENGRLGRKKRSDNEIAIHSIRGGNLASEHYVSFIGQDETIEISHFSSTYDIYGAGAVKGAEVLVGLEAGLYDMEEIIGLRK